MRCWITPVLLWVGVLMILPAGTKAQQLSQYSLYLLNPYAFNPAYAGLDNTLVATVVHRQQWTSLQGAPVTQHVSMSLPVFRLSSGVGLKVENDVIGAHRVTQGQLSYSYQWAFGRNTVLSVGASAGYLQYALDGTKLRAPEGTYAEPGTGTAFTHNDPRLPEGKIQTGSLTGEAGIFLKTPRLDVGLAMQPLLTPALKQTLDGNFALQVNRQYLAYATYALALGDAFTLKPGFLLKTDILETQSEISVVGRWRENTFAGLSYRGFSTHSRDAVCLLAGIRVNEKMTLGYSFDIPLSPLQAANRGSHEVLLRYSLNRPVGAGKLPPVIYNPRHF